MEVLEVIRSVPFFSSLASTEEDYIVENIQLHYFPAGYKIFDEGDEAESMYIIKSGKVKIFLKHPNFHHTVTVLTKNEAFGEMALIENTTRQASAEVLEDCEVLVIHKNVLEKLIKKYPDIANTVSQIYVQRVKENKGSE